MLKRIAIVSLALPAAELVVFLLVVWAVGFLPALGLMILTSFAGGLVLRRAGARRIARIRGAMRDGGAPAETGGVILALSGILLVLPGFITDLLGAGLLLRPIRSRLAAAIGRALGVPGATAPGSVLDLAPHEWHSVPEQQSPKGR